MKHFFTTLLLCCVQFMMAQSSAKVIDAQTGETVPFANISIGTENLVSNSEGSFTFSDESDSVIFVSCIGYVARQVTAGQLRSANNIVKLEPALYELDDVSVKRPDVGTIMANVKQNLVKHYKNQVPVSKDVLFIREANHFKPEKMDIEITKSTGFSKKGLSEANSELGAFTKKMIAHPPLSFTDMLCNYYVPSNSGTKLNVVKATKLLDENRGTSVDQIEKKLTTTMLKHLDTTKYYRIKSGWIGSRDTVSLRKDYKKKDKKLPNNELTSVKGKLTSFLMENSFLEGSKLNFVTEPELYEYAYEGATFLDDDNLVYVVKFTPKKNKAKYTGKLYVSADDFAVIRTDYTLGKGKTEGGINLKWVLGIKASENVSNGTTMYRQNPGGEGYYLQYAAIESGQYFYVHRPLKFIELTDEDKDVVAFDIKVEGNMREKTEYLNISRTEAGESDLANVTEDDFKYQFLKKYDPSIWAAHSAIEPLEEMKRFNVVE